ncbi:MAG: hypothetical protein R3222_09960 [Balneolaceae bacterium]|nr:hypothetical protein [Balneolaceae bacterium]
MAAKFLFLSSIFTLLAYSLTEPVNAQGLGLSTAYSTSNAYYVDFFYMHNSHSYHMGGSYQLADQLGKKVSEQKPNYGRTVVGTGSFFWTLDLGYSYYFKNRIIAGGGLSLGAQNDFTNYQDNRFRGGGYHMIESRPTAGMGFHGGYRFSRLAFAYVGYHTLRKITFGLRFAAKRS